MAKKYGPVTFLFFTLLLSLGLGGCATNPRAIAENPQAWRGKTVTLRGTAGRGFSIPLTDFSVFLLEYSDGAIPVVAVRDRDKGARTSLTGEVWAFPQEEMSSGSADAVNALGNFLLDHTDIDRRRVREVSSLILTALGSLADGLGNLWFVIEVR